MKVAVPVKNDSLDIFGNAGHTPYFAVFSVAGSGMFKEFKLEELRVNPRGDAEHEGECAAEEHEHKCTHGGEDAEAHKEEHRVMAEIIKDCKYLVVKKACKNTKKVMSEAGIEVKSCAAAVTKAKEALRAVL